MLTCVRAWQAHDQSAKHAISIWCVHVFLEESALIIDIELVWHGNDAGATCELLNVGKHPGLARMEGRPKVVALKGECSPIGRIRHLQRQA